MGRMLDTLKQGERRRTSAAIGKATDEAPVQDCVVDWEIAEEVPYVEVGGPNKKVELSPSLLRHPPQATPKAPHLSPDMTAAVGKPALVYLTPTKPMIAAFEPWPAPAPTPLNIPAEVVAFHQPDHPASKQYAVLFDTIRGSLPTGVANALLVVGLKPNVGASTVLLNLAVTAALRPKLRVVVVERRAGLAERLGQVAPLGLAEVLAGSLALEQAILTTGIGSLHLLPAGKLQVTPSREAMAWLIGWLRQRYDVIFIHGPTLDDTPAIGSCAAHANGIYLVLPKGESATATRGIAHAIGGMGGRLCGLIHTHFE